VQVICNFFEQEPADELLPAALEHNVGILVSKYTVNSESPEGDFRKNDFAGDRLVEQLNQRYDGSEPNRRR